MKHNLSGVLKGIHRTSIQATVDEILAPEGESVGLKLMPIVNVPAGYIEHEVVSAYGGMTQERELGEEGKQVGGVSSEPKIFLPASYQEHHRFNEKEILMLRKFGSIGDKGVTGLTDGELSYTTMVGKKLKLRLSNRLQKIAWDAILFGTFKGFNFGIPNDNKINSTTDWSDLDVADVLGDMDKIFYDTAVTRKYIFKEHLANPNLAAKIRQALLKKHGASNYNINNASTEELWKFFLPGHAPIKIVRDMWQDETVNDVTGKVTASPAQYFLPDDKLIPIPELGGSMYPNLGEINITENLNDPSATVDKPAVGIYTFIDEKGLENKKAPHIDVVAGFNGGANLKRPNDTFIISV